MSWSFQRGLITLCESSPSACEVRGYAADFRCYDRMIRCIGTWDASQVFTCAARRTAFLFRRVHGALHGASEILKLSFHGLALDKDREAYPQTDAALHIFALWPSPSVSSPLKNARDNHQIMVVIFCKRRVAKQPRQNQLYFPLGVIKNILLRDQPSYTSTILQPLELCSSLARHVMPSDAWLHVVACQRERKNRRSRADWKEPSNPSLRRQIRLEFFLGLK